MPSYDPKRTRHRLPGGEGGNPEPTVEPKAVSEPAPVDAILDELDSGATEPVQPASPPLAAVRAAGGVGGSPPAAVPSSRRPVLPVVVGLGATALAIGLWLARRARRRRRTTARFEP